MWVALKSKQAQVNGLSRPHVAVAEGTVPSLRDAVRFATASAPRKHSTMLNRTDTHFAAAKLPREANPLEERQPVNMNTLLIIIVVVRLLGGGGFYFGR